MTVIECFEENPIENIICTLTNKPERIIFFGDINLINEQKQRYEDFFNGRSEINCTITPCGVDKTDREQIIKEATRIALEYDDCIFDLTGGEDLILSGVGSAYENLKHTKPFKMCLFDILGGTVRDCISGKEESFEEKIKLSVNELIMLFGGSIVQSEEASIENLSAADINAMWALNVKNSQDFNRFCNLLREFEKKCNFTPFDMDIYLDLSYLRSLYSDFTLRYAFFKNYLKHISATGLLINVHFGPNFVKYSYKKSDIKPLFLKAGNILEYKCFLEAKNLKNACFDDIKVGVFIDWDGIVHSVDSGIKDTNNEVDLVLTSDMVPIFISCKNGKVEEIELYKFNTVADRFGEKYAKKVLIATDLYAADPIKADTIISRAKAMGITLIPKVAKFSKDDWENLFKGLI